MLLRVIIRAHTHTHQQQLMTCQPLYDTRESNRINDRSMTSSDSLWSRSFFKLVRVSVPVWAARARVRLARERRTAAEIIAGHQRTETAGPNRAGRALMTQLKCGREARWRMRKRAGYPLIFSFLFLLY